MHFKRLFTLVDGGCVPSYIGEVQAGRLAKMVRLALAQAPRTYLSTREGLTVQGIRHPPCELAGSMKAKLVYCL